jgi:hypothetical protein
MVANILNSPRAVAMSVYVIRAFVKLAFAGKPGAVGNSPSRPLPLESGEFMHSREFLCRLPDHGGLTRVNEAGYLAGPPELIVEVAASSASIDLRDKRRACCRNGVREYLVWLVAEARLEWFCLEEDDYCHQSPDAQGVLHSRVFPGLQLPVAPLLAGDTATVLAALTGPEPLNTKPPETSVKSG